MSYYKPSFSQTVAMTRGSGRGFITPRGGSSYRGSSGRGSSWNDRGGRGGYSSGRGGGGRFSASWNSNSSFDRPRYQSSSGDRYGSNSRNRPDDSNYRRSYRSEQNSYSGRDSSSHRSPERKRMRTEATSSRRSHEGGYGDGYSGGGNAGRFDSSASYSERRSFAEERRGSFRNRDDYRKPVSVPAGSVRQSPRGGYRGRVSSRGARGNRIGLRDGIIRRRVVDSGFRKRGAAIRSDYLRRLKISRLRSIASRRAMKKSKSSEKSIDSDKEEENWEKEEKDEEKKKKETAEDAAEKSGDEKKSTPKKASPKKEKSKEKDKEGKDEKESEKGSDKEDKKSTKSDSEDEDRPRSRYTGRPFIRLTCTHCNQKCVTFKEYSNHLYNTRHINAMRKIALKQKTALSRMRLTQRNAQRELEKNDEGLAPRTNFCPLCKLNYRQLKSKHQMSDAHRLMKKFLMPYCRTCHITFKSPMLYENHMCSLEHIKRQAQTDMNGDKHDSDKEPSSPTEEDLENFMTLDSVGDVDDEDEGNKTEKTEVAEGEDKGLNKPKEKINVGAEYVKKIEVHYCDLCRVYLSRYESPERAIKNHCRGRMHLQRYVRRKEDRDLKRHAEKIHRKTQEAKEAKDKDKEKEKEKEKEKMKTEKTEKEEGKEGEVKKEVKTEDGDEKMWADVDKDLGEILASEVNNEGGNKSSDEDEDSRPDGERYDRFRNSDKKGDGTEKKDGESEEKEGGGEGEEGEEEGDEGNEVNQEEDEKEEKAK